MKTPLLSPNMFQFKKIENSIEIVDVDLNFNVTYYVWYNVNDVMCEYALVKKNIREFEKEELELLTGNSWLILLMYGYDKLNLTNCDIGYEKLSPQEMQLLTEHLRKDLGIIN
jgi:hypothetical protein